MRHFHCWIEFKNINNGNIEYYRVCKRCGLVQKWSNGYYFDVKEQFNKNWQLQDSDDDNFLRGL